MLFETFFEADTSPQSVARLEGFYRRPRSVVLWLLFAGFIGFIVWASLFRIDQVARASGEVIALSRVQIIQAVDGGVLSSLEVYEGDHVGKGQVLARLETDRIGAAVKEIEAKLSALLAKQARLRAEVTQSDTVSFPPEALVYPESAAVERALFKQRTTGQTAAVRNLEGAVRLAQEEIDLLKKLSRSGDSSRSEEIAAERALNQAEARLIARRNDYFEKARTELAAVEDQIAQNAQIVAQRRQQMQDSVFTANRAGIVKNIRVTTVGGVLRAGEELMQIVPLDDQLLVEAKVSPVDIAQVKEGLEATLRFDPFDYTIHGSVRGKVVYVSADTLKEETGHGEEIYYRVHVVSDTTPVTTTTGKKLGILPGMTAQLDIKTGDRTVLDYLLKPLRKTLSESLGER